MVHAVDGRMCMCIYNYCLPSETVYIYINVYMLVYALYCTLYRNSNGIRKYPDGLDLR